MIIDSYMWLFSFSVAYWIFGAIIWYDEKKNLTSGDCVDVEKVFQILWQCKLGVPSLCCPFYFKVICVASSLMCESNATTLSLVSIWSDSRSTIFSVPVHFEIFKRLLDCLEEFACWTLVSLSLLMNVVKATFLIWKCGRECLRFVIKFQ